MATTDPNTTKGRAASFTRNPNRYVDLVDGNATLYTEIRFHEYSRSINSQVRGTRTTAQLVFPIPFLLNDITNINIEQFELDKIQNLMIAASAGSDYLNNADSTKILNDISKATKKTIESVGGTFNTFLDTTEKTGKMFTGIQAALESPLSAASKGLALQPWANEGASKVAQSYNGIVRNPHMSSIFNGVNLKNFQLNFRVSVGSAKEADALNKAITLIRNRMHPESVGDKLVLKYPDVATMQFVGMREMVPRIKESFIQSLNITNFPQGPAVYRDGTPVEVLIDMTLTEIDARLRDDEDNTAPDGSLIPNDQTPNA